MRIEQVALTEHQEGSEKRGFVGKGLADCNDWFAVYTKPQQEQVALLNLEAQSFECFLPMAEKACQSRSSRNLTRHEPLFPRYLFLKADPRQQSLASVRSTRGVTGLVRAGLAPTTIPASVVIQLRSLIDPNSGLIAIGSAELSDGDKVRIFDGPFVDLEGVFKEHRGQSRSLLLLEILGRETAVEIDERLLQQVN